MTINKDRKKWVINLYYSQGKTTHKIAKIERISIHDISAIRKEEDARRQKYKDQQLQEELYRKSSPIFLKFNRRLTTF